MFNVKSEHSLGISHRRRVCRSTINTWQAVQDEILSRIRNGVWRSGHLIPTEHELAHEMGCARATVNRALNQLAMDGIVERRRRVGTRVTNTPVPQAGAEAVPIRQEVEATGAVYAYHLIERNTVQASDDIAAIMHIPPTASLTRYRALITADHVPYCVETGYLAEQDFMQLTEEMLNDAEPLEWMRKNVPRLSGRMEIHATRLNTECADDLGGERGFPVLTLDRTLWSDGRALSHSRRVYSPGHKVSLARQSGRMT